MLMLGLRGCTARFAQGPGPAQLGFVGVSSLSLHELSRLSFSGLSGDARCSALQPTQSWQPLGTEINCRGRDLWSCLSLHLPWSLQVTLAVLWSIFPKALLH